MKTTNHYCQLQLRAIVGGTTSPNLSLDHKNTKHIRGTICVAREFEHHTVHLAIVPQANFREWTGVFSII